MLRHHPKFYLAGTSDTEKQMLVIQADDCLFRVHCSKLADACTGIDSLFADLFPEDPSDPVGKSDSHPFHLEGSRIQLEQLLYAIYMPEAETSTRMLLVRIAAALRWGAPALRVKATKDLAAADAPVAQLAIARQYKLEAWLWPAMFAICARQEDLTSKQKAFLGADDIKFIESTRELLLQEEPSSLGQRLRDRLHARSGEATVYEKEARLRELLRRHRMLQEPLVSDLRPPLSGFRLRLQRGAYAQLNRLGPAPFQTHSSTPVCLATGKITAGPAMPCAVPMPTQVNARITWKGLADELEILPFDPDRMEWVATSHGQIPRGRTPVEGGYDTKRQSLYFAYGILMHEGRAMTAPGRTGVAMRYAELMTPNSVAPTITEHYHLLVWKYSILGG